jgi:hypothetical protein
MVKCPFCKKGDLLAFLEKEKREQYETEDSGDYSIVYVCTNPDCPQQEVRKEDSPIYSDNE